MNRARGVTLLELLTVIAIIGVLAAIALPSFSYLSHITQVKSAATTVYLAMMKARSEAVKRNASVTLAANNTSDWAAGWTLKDSTNTVIANQDALKGVTITEKNSLTSIVYTSAGRVSAASVPALSVSYVQNSHDTTAAVARCVSLSPSGAPYMLKTGCP